MSSGPYESPLVLSAAMPIVVRPIQPDELFKFVDTMSTVFLDRPNVQGIADEVRTHWDLSRALGAFDDGRPVGTFRSWASRLTVPGPAEVPGSAITGVSVIPTHRRRGLFARMTAAAHAAARDRGEIVAMLYAAEYPIYGRFGYGPATMTSTWTVQLGGTSFVDTPPDAGTIEIVPPDASSRDVAKGVYDAWRVRRPGEIWRRDITWDDDFGLAPDVWANKWKGFVAVHRDAAGDADGYVRYHGEAHWEDRQPRYKLIVDDLHALSEATEVALWRFVASIDLAASIRAEQRTPDDRLPWLLTNRRAAVISEVGDAAWIKLLDIPRALEARRYERSGSIVLEILDADGSDDIGRAIQQRVRVALDVTPDGARATSTDRSPDLTLASGAIGAAYLGGSRLSHAALNAGYDEHRAGAMAEAEALFATVESPWCSTFF